MRPPASRRLPRLPRALRRWLLLAAVLCAARCCLVRRVLPPAPDDAPLLTLGLVTDVQYADVADGLSAWGVPRHYRASLRMLHTAVADWRAAPPHAVVHLGDAVDKGASAGAGGARAALASVTAALASLNLTARLAPCSRLPITLPN
jgi:hypothetical protein